jgi:integrase
LSRCWLRGLRRGELLGLAFDSVDLDRGIMTIRRTVINLPGSAPLLRDTTKTEASARTIKIPPLLIDLLRVQKTRVLEGALKWGGAYRREPMFMFAKPDGEPLDPIGLTVRLRRVMRRAGIAGRAPCHAWRHTHVAANHGTVPASWSRSQVGGPETLGAQQNTRLRCCKFANRHH